MKTSTLLGLSALSLGVVHEVLEHRRHKDRERLTLMEVHQGILRDMGADRALTKTVWLEDAHEETVQKLMANRLFSFWSASLKAGRFTKRDIRGGMDQFMRAEPNRLYWEGARARREEGVQGRFDIMLNEMADQAYDVRIKLNRLAAEKPA